MPPAPDTGFALSSIGQIAIPVQNVDRAVAFYRDRLQMRFLFQAPPRLAFVQCGEVRLMLESPEDAAYDHPASVIYYRVDDIEAAHEALRSRGVDFIATPHVIHRTATHELWMAFFKDTEGNTLAVMAERPA